MVSIRNFRDPYTFKTFVSYIHIKNASCGGSISLSRCKLLSLQSLDGKRSSNENICLHASRNISRNICSYRVRFTDQILALTSQLPSIRQIF